MLDGSVVSVVVDGQEISAAVFGTGDVSLQQVHDILEAYGDQLSEEPHSGGQRRTAGRKLWGIWLHSNMFK